jgi:L-alanine-DL-glutamate epimerase-like enolase superfamily enzyme
MMEATRREMLAASLAAVMAPVQGVAAAAKPVRIRDVDIFNIKLPATSAEIAAGVYHEYSVVEISTDAGVTGYSFAGPSPSSLPQVRQMLAGKDLFAVEQHLRNGLAAYGGVEHAIWDAIGKIAGQPVYRLLGGTRTSVKAYLTCVWPGAADQAQVPFKDQVAMAVKIKKAGFKGMKIRVWRPDPMDDVEVCRQIKAATGPDFSIMFDRTAHAPVEMAHQKIWDYETGLKVARALQDAGAYWLEEPFSREDYEMPAKLAAAVDIPITGGEGYQGTEAFRQCLMHNTYDILQPDGRGAGGILTCRKIGVLAEAYNVQCILHGTMSLLLAGWLQATLSIGSDWQEVALITPPLMPEEQWAPAMKVLRQERMFAIRDGMLQAPESPGLGLDVDPDALRRYRV